MDTEQKKQITATIPLSDYKRYEKIAARLKISLSEFVRLKLRDEPVTEPPDEDDE